MRVIYLGHSGFLVSTERAWYLFDYIRGDIPALSDGKPLYVFVSHSHEDHFCQNIFMPDQVPPAKRYILGYDIRKKYRKSRADWPGECVEHILWAEPGKPITLPDLRIIPLKSTDMGVAYLLEEDGLRIYHAGDLNWWHWEGEDMAWNRNMEVNYKREIDRIKGLEIDLAFVPLDPRQEEAYWYGMGYFLQTVSAKTVFPMHFWKDYGVIDRYLKEHGGQGQLQKIEMEGQEYEI